MSRERDPQVEQHHFLLSGREVSSRAFKAICFHFDFRRMPVRLCSVYHTAPRATLSDFNVRKTMQQCQMQKKKERNKTAFHANHVYIIIPQSYRLLKRAQCISNGIMLHERPHFRQKTPRTPSPSPQSLIVPSYMRNGPATGAPMCPFPPAGFHYPHHSHLHPPPTQSSSTQIYQRDQSRIDIVGYHMHGSQAES